jgi:hypothetical protein
MITAHVTLHFRLILLLSRLNLVTYSLNIICAVRTRRKMVEVIKAKEAFGDIRLQLGQ